MDNMGHFNQWDDLKHRFDSDFAGQVMQRLQKDVATKRPERYRLWNNGILLAAAASVALLLVSVYLTDGSFSKDALIGLEEYNSIDLTETLNHYNDF